MIKIAEIFTLLESYQSEIVCNMCGECCGTCPTRRGNLCGAHPEYSGENPAPDIRAGTCWANPAQLLKYPPHIVCPLVAEKLLQLGYKVTIFRNDRDIPCVANIEKLE